jgi:5-methylcytosine-specific restriction enzyme A
MIEWMRSLVGLGVEAAKTQGKPRSPHWPAVRKAHILAHPTCAACGAREKVEVHHIQPFHLFPERELDPANLITLCESSTRACHLCIGHGGDYARYYNSQVVTDAAVWLTMLRRVRGVSHG